MSFVVFNNDNRYTQQQRIDFTHSDIDFTAGDQVIVWGTDNVQYRIDNANKSSGGEAVSGGGGDEVDTGDLEVISEFSSATDTESKLLKNVRVNTDYHIQFDRDNGLEELLLNDINSVQRSTDSDDLNFEVSGNVATADFILVSRDDEINKLFLDNQTFTAIIDVQGVTPTRVFDINRTIFTYVFDDVVDVITGEFPAGSEIETEDNSKLYVNPISNVGGLDVVTTASLGQDIRDVDAEGTTGQVLTRTATGVEWSDDMTRMEDTEGDGIGLSVSNSKQEIAVVLDSSLDHSGLGFFNGGLAVDIATTDSGLTRIGGIGNAGGLAVDTEFVATQDYADNEFGWMQRLDDRFTTTRRDLALTAYTVVNAEDPDAAYEVRIDQFNEHYELTLRIEDIIPRAFSQMMYINNHLYFVYDIDYDDTARTRIHFSVPRRPMDGTEDVDLSALSEIFIEGFNNDLEVEGVDYTGALVSSQNNDNTILTVDLPNFSVDTDGAVPAPTQAEVDANRVLQADGSWVAQAAGGFDSDEVNLYVDDDGIHIADSPGTAQVSTVTVATLTAHSALTATVTNPDGTTEDIAVAVQSLTSAAQAATELNADFNGSESVTSTVDGSVVTVTWNTAGAISGTPLVITGTDNNLFTVATMTAGASPTDPYTSVDIGTGLTSADTALVVDTDTIATRTYVDSVAGAIGTQVRDADDMPALADVAEGDLIFKTATGTISYQTRDSEAAVAAVWDNVTVGGNQVVVEMWRNSQDGFLLNDSQTSVNNDNRMTFAQLQTAVAGGETYNLVQTADLAIRLLDDSSGTDVVTDVTSAADGVMTTTSQASDGSSFQWFHIGEGDITSNLTSTFWENLGTDSIRPLGTTGNRHRLQLRTTDPVAAIPALSQDLTGTGWFRWSGDVTVGWEEFIPASPAATTPA